MSAMNEEKKEQLNDLLFMDGIKLLGNNEEQIDAPVNKACISSTHSRMKFALETVALEMVALGMVALGMVALETVALGIVALGIVVLELVVLEGNPTYM